MKIESLNIKDENKFWDLVKLANWPNKDYVKNRITYRKLLSKEEARDFRKTVSKAYGILDDVISASDIVEELGVSDDSYEYLLYHIIGLGKEEFYKYANNVKLIKNMAINSEYKEGFSYCIPYDDDYGKNNRYTIEYIINIAKSAVKEIDMFTKMDKDNLHLKDISKDMANIHLTFMAFLNCPTIDNLRVLVNHKDFVNRAAKNIEKFFEKNYLELPRKFTESRKDGSNFNGMCTAIFDNVVGDAEDVLEFLKA